MHDGKMFLKEEGKTGDFFLLSFFEHNCGAQPPMLKLSIKLDVEVCSIHEFEKREDWIDGSFTVAIQTAHICFNFELDLSSIALIIASSSILSENANDNIFFDTATKPTW